MATLTVLNWKSKRTQTMFILQWDKKKCSGRQRANFKRYSCSNSRYMLKHCLKIHFQTFILLSCCCKKQIYDDKKTLQRGLHRELVEEKDLKSAYLYSTSPLWHVAWWDTDITLNPWKSELIRNGKQHFTNICLRRGKIWFCKPPSGVLVFWRH